ncbi:MAG: hypothetical protein JWO60_2192 [Frankiales bacterium]|nr:hypothetical protein [Frankiales bacterium]
MALPTAADEEFGHQLPELRPVVASPGPHWRESFFFEAHDPSGTGDAVFVTLASRPGAGRMDSLQMGRVGGAQVLGYLDRALGDDPLTTAVPGARVEVVRPYEEIRVWADPDLSPLGVDLVWRARTQPYALRRGTLRAADGLVWDQSHVLQSGTWSGTYTAGGTTRSADGWLGQRDHSWGVRDHGRCPLWLWFQVQLDDGFLGVWHWELADGAPVYTDGCWAPTGGGDPVPVVGFAHDVAWTGGAYGAHGEGVTGLAGTCVFTLADGRRIELEASGEFVRPYEPFHRGGLSVVQVRADDGRTGTAVYEVTGARHHSFFPDTDVDGLLPC